MQSYLPNTVEELFEKGENQYRYYSEDSLDNNWSMDWFIKSIGLSEFIILNEGTQIVLHHPKYSYDLQIDAGGLGDFYSHKFDVSICNDVSQGIA
jgi:phage pi2 protein 07